VELNSPDGKWPGGIRRSWRYGSGLVLAVSSLALGGCLVARVMIEVMR
jgi:hypothetical protein